MSDNSNSFRNAFINEPEKTFTVELTAEQWFEVKGAVQTDILNERKIRRNATDWDASDYEASRLVLKDLKEMADSIEAQLNEQAGEN